MNDLLLGRYVEYISRMDRFGKALDYIPGKIVHIVDGEPLPTMIIACFDGTIREAAIEDLSTLLPSPNNYVRTSDGTIHYFKEDSLHREDGPAVIYDDGKKQYWLYGQFFRTHEEWFEALDDIEGAMINDMGHDQ